VRRASALLGACLALCGPAWGGENWPQWRGPSHNGTSDSAGLPLTWSETQNVKWKVPLPSWSGATPAIWGDRIFVASPSAAGSGADAPAGRTMARLKPEGQDLLLLCFSRKDGRQLWKTRLCGGNSQIGKQNMSSPSPVTDGRMVWALTGTGVLTGLDLEGKVVWQEDLQKKYGKFGLLWGYGASPLLWDDKLIVPVMHGMHTDDPCYLVAFDPKTGKVAWRVERPTDAKQESPDSYATPVPMKAGDRTDILVVGGDYVTGHDPKTGREVWRCGGFNPKGSEWWRTVCSPLPAGDMVFGCTKQGPFVACRGGGRGLVTKTHLAWTSAEVACDVPTPVSDGKYLYVLGDGGFMTCFDPKTGKAFYQKQRLPRGTYSASPLLADGKIYVTSERARTTVLAPGPEFKVLAENPLDDDYTLSSIAVSGSDLFIRTSANLYCIGKK